MTAYWYCLLCKIVACTGFVVLAIFDHPWIGLLCIFFSATIDGELKEPK